MPDLKTLLQTLRAYAEVKDRPGYYLDHSRWHHRVEGLPDDHPIRSKTLHDLLEGNDRWSLSVHPHPHYRGSHQVLVQPRHIPEGIVRSVDSNGHPQFHDPAYMALAPAIVGGPDQHRLVPLPGVNTGYLYDKRPGHIYRGMNTEEAASIRASGRVKSREEYNLGGPQDGHTYFADSLDGAMSYGSGYAPRHLQPTFDHPGFTVEMRLPEDARTDPSAIQGEVGVHGGLDRSHITRAWKGRVVGMTSGTTDLYYEPYSGPGEYKDSGRNLPDSKVVWEELQPHEIDHHFGTSLAGRSYADVTGKTSFHPSHDPLHYALVKGQSGQRHWMLVHPDAIQHLAPFEHTLHDHMGGDVYDGGEMQKITQGFKANRVAAVIGEHPEFGPTLIKSGEQHVDFVKEEPESRQSVVPQRDSPPPRSLLFEEKPDPRASGPAQLDLHSDLAPYEGVIRDRMGMKPLTYDSADRPLKPLTHTVETVGGTETQLQAHDYQGGEASDYGHHAQYVTRAGRVAGAPMIPLTVGRIGAAMDEANDKSQARGGVQWHASDQYASFQPLATDPHDVAKDLGLEQVGRWDVSNDVWNWQSRLAARLKATEAITGAPDCHGGNYVPVATLMPDGKVGSVEHGIDYEWQPYEHTGTLGHSLGMAATVADEATHRPVQHIPEDELPAIQGKLDVLASVPHFPSHETWGELNHEEFADIWNDPLEHKHGREARIAAARLHHDDLKSQGVEIRDPEAARQRAYAAAIKDQPGYQLDERVHRWKRLGITEFDGGRPVFYHGTHRPDLTHLKTGEPARRGGGLFEYDQPSAAVFLTPNQQLAQSFAETRADQRGGTPTVYRVAVDAEPDDFLDFSEQGIGLVAAQQNAEAASRNVKGANGQPWQYDPVRDGLHSGLSWLNTDEDEDGPEFRIEPYLGVRHVDQVLGPHKLWQLADEPDVMSHMGRLGLKGMIFDEPAHVLSDHPDRRVVALPDPERHTEILGPVGRSYAARLGATPPPTHRVQADTHLRLAPSRVDPHVQRWQAWGQQAQVPPHRQAQAQRLKDQVTSQLGAWGQTYAEVHAHALAHLPADPVAANLDVHAHHVADGVMRVRAFAPALIDHVYAGRNSDAALERLSHMRLDFGMAGDISDTHYTGPQTGGARGAVLKHHPWMMGLDASPAAGHDGGTITPESTFAHEFAHALDQQRTLAHIPADGPPLSALGFLKGLKGQVMGGPTHADAFHSPMQFADLHEALHAHSRALTPDEKRLRRLPDDDVRVMSGLPLELARLHYPLQGAGGWGAHLDRLGHHGTEWVTTLTESAINRPEALRALDGELPAGAAPLADRLKDFWGFDFPGSEKARADSSESDRLKDELIDWKLDSPPEGRGVPSVGHEHILASYQKKW